MADDIDIEEHDILLNPRMKDYLSALDIKDEPNDKDDEELDDKDDGNSCKDDEDEESRDSGTNYEYGSTTGHPTNSDQPHSSKTILGTKHPNSNNHRLELELKTVQTEEERIRSAIVLLEDWSERLDTNPCFCGECKTLFATRNALDAHNMTSHSFLVAVSEEPLPVKKPKGVPCSHCNTYFEDEGLLIKHMYEIIEGKKGIKPQPSITTNKAVKHTSRKSEQIKTSEESVPNKRSERKSEVANKSDVNESVLRDGDYVYTCPICSFIYKNIHHMRQHTFDNHSSNYEDFVLAPFQPGCKMCVRATTMKSHNNHIKYNHTTEYTTVVTSNDGTPNNQNFDLQPAEGHCKKLTMFRQVVKKESLYKCIECDTEYVNSCSARFHNKTYHPNRRTLVYIGPEIGNAKAPPQYKDFIPKDVIFRCPECSLHFLNASVALLHSFIHKNQTQNKNDSTWKCSECKKNFRKTDQKGHEVQHGCSGKIRCFDFHKNLYPRVLAKCDKCNVYLEERLVFKHKKLGCGKINPMLCRKCNINVNNYPVHRQRHRLFKSDFILIHDFITHNSNAKSASGEDIESMNQSTAEESDFESQESDNATQDESDSKSNKSKRKIAPDSVVKAKKTKLDCDESYILYKCDVCELTTDSYDDVVSHCQKHIVTDNYKPNIKQCGICSLKYNNKCLNKHDDSNVKILTYKYLDLLKDNWFDMFSSLSSVKVDRIISDSKYVTRAIKMYIILDGLPSLTLFKCETCKNYVDASNVYEHTHSCDGNAGNFACKSCGIKFSTTKGLMKHKKIHEDSDVTANSYRIVAFNDEAGRDVNLKLKQFYNNSRVISEDVFETNELRDNIVSGNSKVKFFQCTKCKSASVHLPFVAKHHCLKKEFSRKCFKCGILTSMHAMQSHLKWHSENPSIRRQDILYIPFTRGKLFETSSKMYVYYQCYVCKVLLLNRRHNCGSLKIQECRKCNYIFSMKGIQFHEQRHLEDKNMTRDSLTVVPINKEGGSFEIEETAYKTIYKCASCKCIFLRKSDFCDHHRRKQCFVHRGKRCDKCDLVFDPTAIYKHKMSHNGGTDTPPEIITLNKAGIKDYTLYLCDSCNIHFLNRVTLRLHLKRGHHNSGSEPCRHCGLNICKVSYDEHISVHHDKANYRLEDFNIVWPKIKRNDGKINVNSYNKDAAIKKSNRPKVTKKIVDDDSREYESEVGESQDESLSGESVTDSTNESESRDSVEDSTTNRANTCINNISVNKVDKPSALQSVKYLDRDYDNKLYMCTCGVHFLKYAAIKQHLKTSCGPKGSRNNSKCPDCNHLFTASSLPRHRKVHHKMMKLTAKDFVVLEKNKIREKNVALTFVKRSNLDMKATRYNSVYKCVKCDHCYLSRNAMYLHFHSNHMSHISIQKCYLCSLTFTKHTFTKHKRIHHEKFKYKLKDLHIYEVHERDVAKLRKLSQEHSSEDESEGEIVDARTCEDNYDVKLFKCGECNVYFIDQNDCSEHVGTHTPLDPYDYIACKQCSFQFQIEYLRKHIQIHHINKEFQLDKVLVEEYQPGTQESETYFAIDKVQSRLVSTTTDE